MLTSRERAEQRRIERLLAAGLVRPPRGPAYMTTMSGVKPRGPREDGERLAEKWIGYHSRQCFRQTAAISRVHNKD